MNRTSSLTRTPLPARTTPMPGPKAPIARTEWLPSRSGGSKPRPNAGHSRNQHPRDTGPTPAVRKLVLERDGYACVCCGRSIIGQRYSLGHRLRASQGGKAVPSNLLTFLGWGGQECHGRIDNRENPADEAKGYTIRMGGIPALVPVMFFEASGSGALVYLLDDGTVSATTPMGGVA